MEILSGSISALFELVRSFVLNCTAGFARKSPVSPPVFSGALSIKSRLILIAPLKFEICGVKFGVLICFELRFLQLWERLCGAQIILVPAMWGAQKKAQFFTLLRALALQTRAYVVAVSDGGKAQLKMAKVFYPDGKSAKWAKFNLARIDEFRQNLGINLDEFNQNCSQNLSSNLIQITSNLNKLEQIL